MRARLQARWYDVADSLWFLPAILTGCAAGLAFGMVEIDRALLADGSTGPDWLFGAGVSGAREVLSVIAGTMITVTGVVFSITIVALQLASSQFTPRVLRTFTGDRGNQVVLGVFIATFTYALLVQRTVREAPDDTRPAFVPAASVTVAILLALISIGCLIYYIDHAATSIRASVVIDRAARDTLGLIDDLFPADTGRPARPPVSEELATCPSVAVTADGAGYLQGINEPTLFGLGGGRPLTVRIDTTIGAYILPGTVVATVWSPQPMEKEDARVRDGIRRALVLGPERTLQSDLELGIRQIADIAVRALSPGVNDPTTAMICIDRLAGALVTLAGREEPEETRTGGDGKVRVIFPAPRFEGLVEVAFAQIRHFGAGDFVVAAHLARMLGEMAGVAPPERWPPLARQARLVLASAREQIAIPEDLAGVERAAQWADAPPDVQPG